MDIRRPSNWRSLSLALIESRRPIKIVAAALSSRARASPASIYVDSICRGGRNTPRGRTNYRILAVVLAEIRGRSHPGEGS